ncbi:MAG: methyltransferase domain-containing protein [Salinisphaera sp.]|nr:methyltransferase domain-containing protein [Salinisphaera sp.]
MTEYSEVVRTAQRYYNSDDADTFYAAIWGGQDIHIGVYENDDEPIRAASQRTVARMAGQVADRLGPDRAVIDLGGGYGGSARFLASRYGCSVTSLNLSEVQNERARQLNDEAGLGAQIDVVDGNFEHIPFPDGQFDLVWSQDALLHSGNRAAVLAEVRRVLRPGGELLFTDPMQTDDCDVATLQPVLDRIQLETLGSPGFYRRELEGLGFEPVQFVDLSAQLPRHYQRVHDELNDRYETMVDQISREYADNMRNGLLHWVRGGETGNLCWGIFHFRLP